MGTSKSEGASRSDDFRKRLEESEHLRKIAEEQYAWLLAAQLPNSSPNAECCTKSLTTDMPLFKLFESIFQASCSQHRPQLGSSDFCPAPRLRIRSFVTPEVATMWRLCNRYERASYVPWSTV